MFDSVVGALLT